MPPYRPTAPKPSVTHDGWVALSTLDVATRARLDALGTGEASGAASLRSAGVPVALYLVGACVLVLATLVTITGPSATAFAMPARAALLLIAGAFVGVMIAARRLTQRGQFAPPMFHVGPTTLLTVHAGHLRVLGAEDLDVTNDHIARPGELIDDGVHGAAWLETLLAARSTAQTEPAEVSRDPFRALIESPRRISSQAVRAARFRALALATLAGTMAGAFVEVVPLGLAGRHAARLEREAHAREAIARRAQAELDAQHAMQSATTARARAEQRQQRALAGSESDAREWLQHAGILDDPALKVRVQARLDAICEQRYLSRDDGLAEHVLFTTMLRRACSDPEQSIYYMVNDAFATEGARLLSRHLREVSEWLGVPLAVQPQPMQTADGVHAYVEIEAIPLGPMEGSALGTRRQPMSMTVRLHDRDGDPLGVPAFTERVELLETTTRVTTDGVL